MYVLRNKQGLVFAGHGETLYQELWYHTGNSFQAIIFKTKEAAERTLLTLTEPDIEIWDISE